MAVLEPPTGRAAAATTTSWASPARRRPRVRAAVRALPAADRRLRVGMVKDHGRAEDITQEVFVSALRRMRQTERPIAFKPWIFEIAKNACIDAYRRAGAPRRSPSTPTTASRRHNRLVASDPTPDDAMDAKQDARPPPRRLRRPVGQPPRDPRHARARGPELQGDRRADGHEPPGRGVHAVPRPQAPGRGVRRARVRRALPARSRRSSSTPARRGSGARPAQLARHVAHCQPCRRLAAQAGPESRCPRARGWRASWRGCCRCPACLRLRRGGDDVAAASGGGGRRLVGAPARVLRRVALRLGQGRGGRRGPARGRRRSGVATTLRSDARRIGRPGPPSSGPPPAATRRKPRSRRPIRGGTRLRTPAARPRGAGTVASAAPGGEPRQPGRRPSGAGRKRAPGRAASARPTRALAARPHGARAPARRAAATTGRRTSRPVRPGARRSPRPVSGGGPAPGDRRQPRPDRAERRARTSRTRSNNAVQNVDSTRLKDPRQPRPQRHQHRRPGGPGRRDDPWTAPSTTRHEHARRAAQALIPGRGGRTANMGRPPGRGAAW